MSSFVDAISLNGSSRRVNLDKIPDLCPICQHRIQPQIIYSSFSPGENSQTVFRCVYDRCGSLFIGTYLNIPGARIIAHKLRSVAPYIANKIEIEEEIQSLSPSFCEIYTQAMVAEGHKLSQLVGVGLRKALEFLIKDYTISKNPTDADAIKSMMLMPCINEYVSDTKIKQCAIRATWLGNDETHYVRKWKEKDIEDLKILLFLTKNWIISSIVSDRYLDEMPGRASVPVLPAP